ncbi:MAG: ATP-grasp domain-containing protein [Clostridiales bacterium]|jgi:biotin carboxylase|nr:ATP-grasp domain-containing protein [Clostridiales bacterium]
MATVMLLGGSNAQVSAARHLKAMGHRAVLVDYLEDPPAKAVCDVHVRASTFDADACIRAAREHRVDGVFTLGTDQPVFTAALVADALGLPSAISVDTARKATDKRAMKEAFRRFSVPHAPYALLKPGDGPEALSRLEPPLVLKPVDSQGQRGVFKLDSREEAVSRLPEALSFSRAGEALVEQYCPSTEVTLSCFAWEGRAHVLSLTDRQLVDDPVHLGVCRAHRYPSVHAARFSEFQALAERTAEALGVQRGPLYIQMLVGDGGILVNEAACRIGGAFEDAFLPRISGFDILDASLRLALGGEPDVRALGRPPEGDWQVSVQMLFCRPGVVARVTPVDEVLRFPGVLLAGYNYGVGSRLPKMENAVARFGHCVLASRGGDMADRVGALYRALRIEDAQGENLLLPGSYDDLTR